MKNTGGLDIETNMLVGTVTTILKDLVSAQGTVHLLSQFDYEVNAIGNTNLKTRLRS